MDHPDTHSAAADPRTATPKALGRWGEDLAAQYLAERGCLILDRNWRCRDGEMDLIAWDSPEVVMCEVRTRRGNRAGSALESITLRKQRRLRRLAAAWLADQDRSDFLVRIDALGIQIGSDGRCTIEHVRGVA
jgi:putative endonuclease